MKYNKPGLYYMNGAASACADGSSAVYTEPGGACAPTGVSAVSLYGPGGAGCAYGTFAGAPIYGSYMCKEGGTPSSTSCGNGHSPAP